MTKTGAVSDSRSVKAALTPLKRLLRVDVAWPVDEEAVADVGAGAGAVIVAPGALAPYRPPCRVRVRVRTRNWERGRRSRLTKVLCEGDVSGLKGSAPASLPCHLRCPSWGSRRRASPVPRPRCLALHGPASGAPACRVGFMVMTDSNVRGWSPGLIRGDEGLNLPRLAPQHPRGRFEPNPYSTSRPTQYSTSSSVKAGAGVATAVSLLRWPTLIRSSPSGTGVADSNCRSTGIGTRPEPSSTVTLKNGRGISSATWCHKRSGVSAQGPEPDLEARKGEG